MTNFHQAPATGLLEECSDEACCLPHFVPVPPAAPTRVEVSAAETVWRAFHEGIRLALLSPEDQAFEVRGRVFNRSKLASDKELLRSYESEGRAHLLLATGGSEALCRSLEHQRAAMEVTSRLQAEGVPMHTRHGRLQALQELVLLPAAKELRHLATLLAQAEAWAEARKGLPE